LDDIKRNSEIADIVAYDLSDALASKTKAPYDEVVIWARPTLRGYKAVWRAAAGMGLVDEASSIDTGSGTVDIDHVFPKSWTKFPGREVQYVRLFPIWREVNRRAGGGRERLDPYAAGFKPNPIRAGIYYATDLQLRKMLNLPVGSTSDRTETFKRR
jgi:hypothetical protein